MKRLFFLAALFGFSVAQAQRDDPPYTKMSLDVLTPLHFQYTSAEELLAPKLLPNALRLKLKVKQEGTMVMAQINFANQPGSAVFQNKMALVLVSTDSPNLTGSAGDKVMGGQPVMLFAQPASSGGTRHYEYLYSLKLNPPETFVSSTNSNFAITFTISLQ